MLVLARAQNHHAPLVPPGTQLAKDFYAVHPRHVHVQDDHPRRILRDHVQRFRAVLRHANLIAFQRQKLTQQPSDDLLVVHHENRRAAPARRGSSLGLRPGREGREGKGRLLQGAIQGFDQHFQGEAFSQKIRQPQLPGPVFHLFGSPGRQHHDDRLRIERPDLFEHRQPVDARHGEVQQGDAGTVLLIQPQGLPRVRCRDDLVASPGKHRPQEIADHQLVIDDQNLRHSPLFLRSS